MARDGGQIPLLQTERLQRSNRERSSTSRKSAGPLSGSPAPDRRIPMENIMESEYASLDVTDMILAQKEE
ncbi:hypothetical protein, partial [Streptomyces sp. 1222.5]|uniref:hypothetical protein n=1 Tax=Streptomyces sp. 1222.5 TaxID=1881026 RepID=UPI003EBBF53A